MIKFKCKLILEFEETCIAKAREKLDKLLEEIKSEVVGVKDIYIDENSEKLFNKICKEELWSTKLRY